MPKPFKSQHVIGYIFGSEMAEGDYADGWRVGRRFYADRSGHYSRKTKWALVVTKLYLHNLRSETQLPYPTEEFFCNRGGRRPRPDRHD